MVPTEGASFVWAGDEDCRCATTADIFLDKIKLIAKNNSLRVKLWLAVPLAPRIIPQVTQTGSIMWRLFKAVRNATTPNSDQPLKKVSVYVCW